MHLSLSFYGQILTIYTDHFKKVPLKVDFGTFTDFPYLKKLIDDVFLFYSVN